MQRELDGWRSVVRRRADGAIDTEQRVPAKRPLVEPTGEGARRLGSGYWREVDRAGRGLVRSREQDDGVRLLFLGLPPPLLAFGPAQVAVDGDRISCSYAIRGGLLARRPGGFLSVVQSGGRQPELSVAVTGYLPRLGVLYAPQRRFHVSVSRRFLRRVIAGTSA
jgi:hypothetical protein